MKFVLNKKPKGATIIQGFPSMGLVSTIATKFLIDHLEVEEIGHIESEHLIPLTAIHKSKVVNPITIYYNKKHNLVIIQSLTGVEGYEWELATTMLDIAKNVSAKEIIILESIPSHNEEMEVFYFSNKNKLKLKQLSEGLVMGTTAALLLRARDSKEFPITCLFAQVHSQLPDSEAAAKEVEALNTYLKLNVNYKPLLEEAKKFEARLKTMFEKRKDAMQNISKSEKKELSYFG